MENDSLLGKATAAAGVVGPAGSVAYETPAGWWPVRVEVTGDA